MVQGRTQKGNSGRAEFEGQGSRESNIMTLEERKVLGREIEKKERETEGAKCPYSISTPPYPPQYDFTGRRSTYTAFLLLFAVVVV